MNNSASVRNYLFVIALVVMQGQNKQQAKLVLWHALRKTDQTIHNTLLVVLRRSSGSLCVHPPLQLNHRQC